ncbi:RhoGAP-domain-containing protein [Annulohypoxylon maeteangense]|uniref:RhoGAP-domain-containing protein n=1 Tax=Annulohypoxylon maeteangense TaxID=1927788 RepID=UPI0020088024|nr:RhoGAP-domain-containing protein [Annulohypoxylon maeteangense]KAI0889760.1 RhoGAP-domain-containing protein [Annulohypoxylon maeteangense]
MSHLSLQCSESPPDSQVLEDSPTIGRVVVNYPSADTDLSSFPSVPFSTQGTSKQRKPIPSPLQTSTAVSPPSSASPSQTKFPEPVHESFSAASFTQVLSRQPPQRSPVDDRANNPYLPGNTYRKGDISPVSPLSSNYGARLLYSPSNDTRSVSDPTATTRSPVGSAGASLPNMAGNPVSSKPDTPPSGAPRTSSIDSAISAISSRTHSHQGSQDAQSGTADISNLYLLKEKHSQSQQNAQLWRLVDKQRAMILGLNKDLERALKDKEKYRKKLKDVMAAHEDQSKFDFGQSSASSIPRVNVNVPKEQEIEVPASPSNLDSDSVKHSPIDVSLAPYPITPPADHITNGLPSAVGELLDPSHAMPKASEHALDHFDREGEDRAAEEARKVSDASRDPGLPINLSLPPSRSLRSEPPRVPPPKRPADPPPAVSVIEATPLVDQGISQFPPPSAPPPRKPPPAPLQLKKESKVPALTPPEDEEDSDSDYDSLLEVDELPIIEKRGRRKTREEDDREREILAEKEAEARSLSKKSKKGSQKPTVKEPESQYGVAASPRMAGIQPMLAPDNMHASLAGVLSGNEIRQTMVVPPSLAPGLPASPRPMPPKSPMNSPAMSPRSFGMGLPLSPRAPRQPIPMPPNMSSPPAAQSSSQSQPSPPANRDSPTERTKIYKGFVTEEYPDLLLPPNALPSIEVRVASSRMKPSRASLLSLTQLEEDPVFTLAVFSRSERVELWRVEKDTTSLSKLDQKMKQCSSFTAKTPDRSLFSGHSPAKLDARRTILDQYLDELLNSPLDTPTALELCKYLSTNTLRPSFDDPSSTNESSIEANTQKKGPGGRPFKNGYLTKRGKNFGGWKARFFVLDGPHLKYYEAPGGAHLGTIKLQNAQIGKQSQQTNDGSPSSGPNGDELDNQYRHAFLVLEPKKKDSSSHVKHVLCAESDLERDQWVETLLRWIDYKDKDDEEAHPPAGHDRSHGGSNTHANANLKKKGHGHVKNQGQKGSQDGLIGMSYNAAKQGDIPDGAPTRRKTGTPDLQDRANGPTYTISAPKDPQLIPDSASWGNKMMGLAPPGPTTEEKKQRKRSFFGFGPKTRSSSDDQDPLYSSNAGSVPQGLNEPRGPIRQVFGAPLAEAVRFNGPFDVSVPLPAVVFRCIQYLDAKNAILEEGIFRLSGSNVVIKQLRERFNTEGDVNLVTDETYYDIHAVASLLKLYLRELPTTILTRDLHMGFVAAAEMDNQREKIASMAELVQKLPLANETLLKYLIAFLIKIINHANMNKMTVRNVGIVFSPTLNIPAPVFALLLQNYEGIFGLDPEEYELPSPDMEADSRPPLEAQPRRPSTATDSPQRQRLMEQMQSRSTPTPPPGVSSSLRPTATPPPRQTSYEPHYLAQAGSQSSLRPSYESGFVQPGYEAGARQPGYDRPIYGNSYEQEFNENSLSAYDPNYNKNKRRESSMFMGNVMLNQQGSKSRLREETRM